MNDPKYTFTYEFDGVKNTTEFTAIGLATLLENFELFLKGNGFVLKGNIDVVEDESDNLHVDYDTFGL